MEYKDFGEKIGGAKKDLWASRGLYVDDLEAMNDRETEKYVKKDNIWKKPDYQALIQSGIPVDVVYFIKTVRDSLNATPRYYRTDGTPEKRKFRQQEYIETIRKIQGKTEKIRTKYEALLAFDDILIQGGYVERKTYGISGATLSATQKGIDNPTVTNRLVSALHFSSEMDYERRIVREAARRQFGAAPAAKNATAKKNGKKRFIPEQLEHVRRTGPDYRNGWDVTGQNYIDAFGFRGGEYGNWMSQDDRRESMNMGYEALKDLAAVLQISEKDISYQGALSIAFGARGSGNAVAHYEPLRKVINLTKMRSAGSLAHEWWHGLDDYLGTLMGANGMLSENSRLYAPFQKLIDTMKYKTASAEQISAQAKSATAMYRANGERLLDSVMWYPLQRLNDGKVIEAYEELKKEFLSGKVGSVEKISAFRKKAAGRVIPKQDRVKLEVYERLLGAENTTSFKPMTQKTDFYRNSIRMGRECQKDGGYWESNTEMTARAFACYVKDRLPFLSDYLAGHADCACTLVAGKSGEMEVLKAFPVGDERQAINNVFDEIFDELKKEGILHFNDHPNYIKRERVQNHPEITMIPDVKYSKQLSFSDLGII